MKRIFTFGIIALGLIMAHATHAVANESEKIKAHMVENYLLWQVAFKNADADRIISFESTDFTRVLENGTVADKATADAATRLWTSRIRKVYDARVYIKKITILPSKVVIWAVKELDADMNSGTDPDKPQIQHIRFAGTSRDTWVKYDGEWVLKRVENLTFKADIDGTPATGN